MIARSGASRRYRTRPRTVLLRTLAMLSVLRALALHGGSLLAGRDAEGSSCQVILDDSPGCNYPGISVRSVCAWTWFRAGLYRSSVPRRTAMDIGLCCSRSIRNQDMSQITTCQGA